MIKENIWNVPLQRAVTFFREQEDITEEGATAFVFRSCRIVLKELKPAKSMGIWSSKRIHMRLEGEDADVEAIYRRFFIQFLSLG